MGGEVYEGEQRLGDRNGADHRRGRHRSSAVAADAGMSSSFTGHRHVDHPVGARPDAPQCGRAFVAQSGALATGECGGHPQPPFRYVPAADGKDIAPKWVQAAARHPMFSPIRPEAKVPQLRTRNNALLHRSEFPSRPEIDRSLKGFHRPPK